MREFINTYGMGIISTILTAIIGFIGMKLKKILDDREQKDTVEKVAHTVVNAIEQMYPTYAGVEKYEIAFSNLTEMLESKGIHITELECKMVIESCVAEFNKVWNKESE